MMKTNILSLSLITLTLLTLSACSDKEKTKSLTEGGMKCDPGKCGASMVNGSAVLVKKKMNILDQMRKDDTRRDCVLKTTSTKHLYDCIKDPRTGRITTKCSADNSVALQKKSITKKAESMK